MTRDTVMRLAPLLCVVLVWLVVLAMPSTPMWALLPLTLLLAVGGWDLLQRQHSLFRNYPLSGRLRMLAESIRPQIHQYFVESDTEGKPFDREQRSLVYQRAKQVADTMPFGTERIVTNAGYEWINHSIASRTVPEHRSRVTIGAEQCQQPYSSSLLNISAMSFGALSGRAIEALNLGAQLDNFAHNSGEGGLSHHHLHHNGDLIWEIGTGYFGCRTAQGDFDPARFADQAANEQVKMIEIKISQGAKPGHGGLLPAAKISPEIARARGIPEGQDCVSPPHHRAFDTPLGLLEFVAQLRELSGGKPTGFKLCIGHPWEFLGICKAVLQSGLSPDFIVVDGKEGGTGAAPVEFSDHVGMPLRDGLLFAHNALVGAGIRDRVRIGASGKVISGFDMAITIALGADWCAAARGFMLALGCLQSQKCHTNHCPVGIATQNVWRERAIDVNDKSHRVANFHKRTTHALEEIAAAVGVTEPAELQLQHFYRRAPSGEAVPLSTAYEYLATGTLANEAFSDEWWERMWTRAKAEKF